MIAKVGKGENLMGALSYNQLKVDKENGKILLTHKIPDTVDGIYTVGHLYRSFEPYLLANNKTEKPVLHISLNPDPKDQVSDEKFKAIAEDYMEQMGYGDQPFVVFKHTDIDRTHIHIVSTSVAIDGKKISDKYDRPRSMKICRELETKYQLTPATEKSTSVDDRIFSPVNYKKGDIKSQIASVIRHVPKYYRFQSLGEYNALLSLFNITSEEVKGELHGIQKQGLVYFALNENGEKASNPFKASLFGKSAGYTMLQGHFATSAESLKKEPVKGVIKNTIDRAIHKAKDEKDFKKQLLDQGINTVVRRTSEGRIYGITFIDHRSKTVWNGSRLGKEFSAGIFNEWWNNNQKPEVKNTQDEKPHHLFNFPGKDEPDFVEGLGGLLPVNNGDDFEEHLFENQMKKRKKRKPGQQM
ncbi:conjugal transfer protein MobB [Chryseobacterium lathyri]|uniref:Mobilization protein n=1 Tax=Chryseobacterium lathyri TaxID=395933 RepID=A0A511Y7K7_9FLAO|nr:conjugal transfer protein MobB [Chryseobacterium lathyri]GEN71177.1 mobilization protein [Chryseobacterium lathyri]